MLLLRDLQILEAINQNGQKRKKAFILIDMRYLTICLNIFLDAQEKLGRIVEFIQLVIVNGVETLEMLKDGKS